jgi:uncharacterized protein YcbK (DUF882 family)
MKAPRRSMVQALGGALVLGSFGATFARALRAKEGAVESSPASSAERSLELKNLHTGEVLTVTFERAAGPDAETAAKLRHFLRDYRADEEHPMDAALYGLLVDLAEGAGYPARYEVISAYRSPHTNAQLHAAGHAVAEHSLHMEGRAIDVRLLGCELERLRDVALRAGRGGVGFYPSSNFVHVDTGRVRTWAGR